MKMSPEMAQMVGKSFGLGEGVIAGMRKGIFSPNTLAKAPTYSDKEIGALDRANVAWLNLGNTIQMAFGHFNAKHGGALVGDISKTVGEVMKLVEVFTKLGEKVKVFEVIDEIFKGWGLIFEGISSGIDKLMQFTGSGEKGGKDSVVGKNGELKENPVAMLRHWVGNKIDQAFAPQVTGPSASGGGNASNVTVQQNITHHGDAKDTQAVKDLHKTAINQAYRQRPAQKQGS